MDDDGWLDDGWLWEALGLTATVTKDVTGAGLRGLVGLALRRNPRRAHLLVSRVLGKHLPVRPLDALGAGAALAAEACARSAACQAAARGAGAPLVLGYCETATALGHAVADGIPGADYLHTTRRAVAGMPSEVELAEAHSHAVHHWLLPADRRLLTDPRPLLLVDDELSTGNTALGTIRVLHALAPRPAYTVAALLDARPAPARVAFDRLADELGVPVDVVSLVSATLQLPPDVADRARAIRERFAGPGPAALGPATTDGAGRGAGGPVGWVRPDWPAELPDGGRHGWTPAHGRLLDEVAGAAAATTADRLNAPGGRTLVLGTEELMYTPMRLAAALAVATGGAVRYQSTTRSPVHALDVSGYAIRSALEFPAPDDPSRVSQVYNVAAGISENGPGAPTPVYDDIVVVVDDGTDAAAGAPLDGPATAGLVEALGRHAPVTVVTLPSFVPGGAR